jgi:hypothetical protein
LTVPLPIEEHFLAIHDNICPQEVADLKIVRTAHQVLAMPWYRHGKVIDFLSSYPGFDIIKLACILSLHLLLVSRLSLLKVKDVACGLAYIHGPVSPTLRSVSPSQVFPAIQRICDRTTFLSQTTIVQSSVT